MPELTIIGPSTIKAFVRNELGDELRSDVKSLIRQDPKASDLCLQLIQIYNRNLPADLLEILDKRFLARA